MKTLISIIPKKLIHSITFFKNVINEFIFQDKLKFKQKLITESIIVLVLASRFLLIRDDNEMKDVLKRIVARAWRQA